MARKVAGFEEENLIRYPWHQWTDGSVWEIRQREDYVVPTENMRVNLHERAKQQGQMVKTQKVSGAGFEGLRFQFMTRSRDVPESMPRTRMPSAGRRHPGRPENGF